MRTLNVAECRDSLEETGWNLHLIRLLNNWELDDKVRLLGIVENIRLR